MRPNSINTDTAASALFTTAEAKPHLRVTGTAEDTYIDFCISAATKFCENYTKRQIMAATYVVGMDTLPSSSSEPVYMPFGNLTSASSVNYKDSSGSAQTWTASNYQVATRQQPGYILPVEGKSYPETQNDTIDAATITFVCGWATSEDVPADIKSAVYIMVSYFYENRGTAELVGSTAVDIKPPFAVYSLLDPYSLREFV